MLDHHLLTEAIDTEARKFIVLWNLDRNYRMRLQIQVSHPSHYSFKRLSDLLPLSNSFGSWPDHSAVSLRLPDPSDCFPATRLSPENLAIG